MDENAYLQKALAVLKEKIEAGNIRIEPQLHHILTPAMMAIKTSPDGGVDLSTVDEKILNLAKMVYYSDNRKKIKEGVSPKQVQCKYFETISLNFQYFFDAMIKGNGYPESFASYIAKDPKIVQALVKSIPDFLGWVREFWKYNYLPMEIHTQDALSLKGVFGGALYAENGSIASKCGIYLDTILIPDPFLRCSYFLENDTDENKVYYFLAAGLSILLFKELVLADVSPPIMAVMPDRYCLEDDYKKFVEGFVDKDIVNHCNLLFGECFSSRLDCQHFLCGLKTPEEIISLVKDKSKLILDLEDGVPIKEQLDNLSIEMARHDPRFANPGHAFYGALVGRMRQANEVILKGKSLNGTPLFETPTSWQYFQWVLNYKTIKNNTRGCVVSALLDKNSSLDWLGNIPHKTLIELRKHDALPELRSILTSGLSDIQQLSTEEFFQASGLIATNMEKALKNYYDKLNRLKKEQWISLGLDLSTCLISGGIELASACGFSWPSCVKSAVENLTNIDIPKLKDIPQRFEQKNAKIRNLSGTAMGLLFEARNSGKKG